MKYAAHFYPGLGLASALQRWASDVLAVADARWRFKIRWETVQSCEPEAEAFNVHQALRLALAQSGIHLKFEPWSHLNEEGVLGMAVWVCWPQPDGRVLQRSAADFVEEASQDGLFCHWPIGCWKPPASRPPSGNARMAPWCWRCVLQSTSCKIRISSTKSAACVTLCSSRISPWCLRWTHARWRKTSRNRWPTSKH